MPSRNLRINIFRFNVQMNDLHFVALYYLMMFAWYNAFVYIIKTIMRFEQLGINMAKKTWAAEDNKYAVTKKYNFITQIKIFAEYRDMLLRPRLVCQDPGLRPIGRRPDAPDKSIRGLGSMSRYSVKILICFIGYILLFFTPLGVWLGTL